MNFLIPEFNKEVRTMKKCIYCKCDVDESSVIDFCDRCGTGVFGDKMLTAIKQNMQEASKRGDLEQGRF